MFPSLPRRANYGTQFDGVGGVHPWRPRAEYETYKSPHGPQYKMARHFYGINMAAGTRYAVMAGSFGAMAGVFALFFFGEVPRVRNDILAKAPLLGSYFHRETPPEDNPF